MRKVADYIALVNLNSGGAWVFQFFPSSISTDDRANWEAANISTGTKPLIYANREAQRIEINDVWLDSSETDESLKQDIEGLRDLMKQSSGGTPPPLLSFICGDWQQKVVLESLRTERQLFDRQGRTIRARVSLTLIEVARNEQVPVRIVDPPEEATRPRTVEATTFNPAGNF